MSKSSTTVRDVFEIPKAGEAKSSEGWKAFRERLSKEVKGIKTAAMPDIAAKVGDLLEVPIPDIFLSSWKKTNALRDILEESKKSPEALMHLELGEHTINSKHRPHIEVKIQKMSVKKLEFTLKLVFKLKGFILKVQNGAIREMQTGLCEARGTLEYQDLTIVDRKLAPITLPGSVRFGDATEVAQPKPAGQHYRTSIATEG